MSQEVQSIRPYDGLRGIWDMVARTAYIQLRSSAGPVGGYDFGDGVGCISGLPAAMCAGIGLAAVGVWDTPTWVLLVSGAGGWGLMSAIYTPMLKWYRLNCWWGPLLPIAGLSVHADDRGLGAEVLDEKGRGVEGADLLSQMPVRPSLGAGDPIRPGRKKAAMVSVTPAIPTMVRAKRRSSEIS